MPSRPLAPAPAPEPEPEPITTLSYPNASFTAGAFDVQSSVSQKEKCSDESIYRVHESLFTLFLSQNEEFSDEVFGIYRRILEAMRQDPRLQATESNTQSSLENWDANRNPDLTLQFTQKHTHNASLLPKLFPAPVPEERGSFTLAIDYILFNAKSHDHRGPPPNLKRIRDGFHNSVHIPLKGSRRNRDNSARRSQAGIVNFDLPILNIPNAQPWKKWGRDVCTFSTDNSEFNLTSRKLNIPIVCGLSGTTTMILWSILNSGVTLNANDLRLIILSIWIALNFDGGHSLQEILSAIRLSSDFIAQNLSNEVIRNSFSPETLTHLFEISRSFSGTGALTPGTFFGSYSRSFFKWINLPSFQSSRTKTSEAIFEYLNANCST